MKDQPKNSALVYSTEVGRVCPGCRQARAHCQCRPTTKHAAAAGVISVSKQTKGRAGKVVTLVRGLPLDGLGLAALGQQLRSVCGAGGTVREGVVEVQGEHCKRIIEVLKHKGFDVKHSAA